MAPNPMVRGGHALTVKHPKLPSPGGKPTPGSAGWKAYTAKRWKTNHPYAGQEGVDPVTGEPKAPNAAEIRAKANADAWKNIQQQQAALPDETKMIAQYGGQRQDIANLVSAHRSWLEKAGEYQVSMANSLAQAAMTTASSGDAGAAAGAAAAGAPAGASFGSNVAPGAVGLPVSAYGTSAANYLHSLVPYATAQGTEAMTRVNQAQDTALDDLRSAKEKIASGLPELELSNFKDRYGLAVEQYKSELAALVSGQKGGLDAAKFAESKRHNAANEATAARNAATSEERAAATIRLNASKLAKKTPASRSALQKFFKDAANIYEQKGGKKSPGLWTVTIKMQTPSLPGAPKLPPVEKTFTQPTLEAVRKQRDEYIRRHPGKPVGPIPAGTWSQGESAHPVQNTSGQVTGQYGESTRRLKAWRYLMAQNATLGADALPESELKRMFRQMFGAPKGG